MHLLLCHRDQERASIFIADVLEVWGFGTSVKVCKLVPNFIHFLSIWQCVSVKYFTGSKWIFSKPAKQLGCSVPFSPNPPNSFEKFHLCSLLHSFTGWTKHIYWSGVAKFLWQTYVSLYLLPSRDLYRDFLHGEKWMMFPLQVHADTTCRATFWPGVSEIWTPGSVTELAVKSLQLDFALNKEIFCSAVT